MAEKQSVVISGGTGFIGSNIVKYLFKNTNKNIIVFDRTLKSGNMICDKRITYIQTLLEDKNTYQILDKYKFDTFFHCGAISNTLYDNEKHIMQVNAESMYDIINLCKSKNATLIYSSSASIYGNTNKINNITDEPNPETFYAKSKLAMENIAKKEHNNMKIIGLRYFNVYGTGEQYKGKMASMIHQMINGHNKLFKSGEHKRDFVYVKDIIMANICASQSQQSGIYGVGTGVARSFNDIVKILNDNKINLNITYIDNPYSFYQNFTQANIEETQKKLNYYPKYSLDDGIKDMLDYKLLQQPEGTQ